MFKKIAFAGIGIALLASPFLVSAQVDTQALINSLLAQVKALQAQLAQLQGQGGNTGTPCVNLSHSIGLDDTDADTNGDVTALQQFLGGRVTGDFGPAT